MLRLSDIKKSYGTNNVITSLDFIFKHRGIYCICGSNGVGKSTLLRLIGGAESVDLGSIEWEQWSLNKNPLEYRHAVCWTPPIDEMFSFLSPLELCKMVAGIRGIKKISSIELINNFGLTSYQEMPYQSLSLGNKQKTLLTLTLMTPANVLLFDEPYNGLDENSVNFFNTKLSELAPQRLIIMTCHNHSFSNNLDVNFLDMYQNGQYTQLDGKKSI